jgi:hypothetical protein
MQLNGVVNAGSYSSLQYSSPFYMPRPETAKEPPCSKSGAHGAN